MSTAVKQNPRETKAEHPVEHRRVSSVYPTKSSICFTYIPVNELQSVGAVYQGD